MNKIEDVIAGLEMVRKIHDHYGPSCGRLNDAITLLRTQAEQVRQGKEDDWKGVQAFARHRQQSLAEAQAEVARLREAVEKFAKALESHDFYNVSKHLSAAMCCNGWMCGCQGSSVGDYLAYELRSALQETPRHAN